VIHDVRSLIFDLFTHLVQASAWIVPMPKFSFSEAQVSTCASTDTFMTRAEYCTTHIKDRESQINSGGSVICLDPYPYLIVGSCLAYN
jgi:hypothetical protein